MKALFILGIFLIVIMGCTTISESPSDVDTTTLVEPVENVSTDTISEENLTGELESLTEDLNGLVIT